MKATLTMAVAGLTFVTLVAGCGGSGKSGASGTTTPAATGQTTSAEAEVSPPDSGVATITISGSGFGTPVTANPGEPITLVNKDSVPYTVASGSSFNVEVKAGGTASFKAPTVPGDYPLTSRSRPKMHGTLTVRGI